MTKSPQQNLPPFSLLLFYLPITFTSKNRITDLLDSYLTLTRTKNRRTSHHPRTSKHRSPVECPGRGVCQRQGNFIANDRTWTSLSSFLQNSVGFGEADEHSAMLRARCSPWPNDSSFYNLEFLSEQPNYRRREGLLLLHAAADSVETWLYFSQSLSPDLDPFVRLSALRSRSSPPRSSTRRTGRLSLSPSHSNSRAILRTIF